MLIDTHCHINMMIKKRFDILIDDSAFSAAQTIVQDAEKNGVGIIINVGTSLIESKNCITLAQWFKNNYAVVGIHPNDATDTWQKDLAEITTFLKEKEAHKIVGIGECGLDFHYPGFNLQRQKDAFRAQIELALTHDVGLVVHSRDARDETLRVLEEYKGQMQRGIIHCFSEDRAFAQQVIQWDYAIGLGGTISYPKNKELREVATTVPLASIVLETDAPFLPPQPMRGKRNSPSSIAYIAEYLAELSNITTKEVAEVSTKRAQQIFGLPQIA